MRRSASTAIFVQMNIDLVHIDQLLNDDVFVGLAHRMGNRGLAFPVDTGRAGCVLGMMRRQHAVNRLSFVHVLVTRAG